jgi:hypothetical protein
MERNMVLDANKEAIVILLMKKYYSWIAFYPRIILRAFWAFFRTNSSIGTIIWRYSNL